MNGKRSDSARDHGVDKDEGWLIDCTSQEIALTSRNRSKQRESMVSSSISARSLKYASTSYASLQMNQAHQFAAGHALRLYGVNAIYSFIPKNACSTLRLSFAIANGCIDTEKDFNWIHRNNATFGADLASLVTASYTFTILRCPYSRLASVYLDKIVNRDREAWHYLDQRKRDIAIDEITFHEFVYSLRNSALRKSNIHWRPQVDFLVYKRYDDYFCVEQFPAAVTTLREKIGLSIVDARPLTKHGINDLVRIHDGSFAHTAPSEILNLRAKGRTPDPKALYTDELIGVVDKHYASDIKLYKRLFGDHQLLIRH